MFSVLKFEQLKNFAVIGKSNQMRFYPQILHKLGFELFKFVLS